MAGFFSVFIPASSGLIPCISNRWILSETFDTLMWKSLASFGLWRGKRGSSEFELSIISLTYINKGWFHLTCKGNGEVRQILHKWFHFLCGELGIHISSLAAASWLHCGRQWVLYFGRWSCPFRLTTCLLFGQSPVAHSRATLPMNEKWMCRCSLAGAMHLLRVGRLFRWYSEHALNAQLGPLGFCTWLLI